jgi:hypothetical protein
MPSKHESECQISAKCQYCKHYNEDDYGAHTGQYFVECLVRKDIAMENETCPYYKIKDRATKLYLKQKFQKELSDF